MPRNDYIPDQPNPFALLRDGRHTATRADEPPAHSDRPGRPAQSAAAARDAARDRLAAWRNAHPEPGG